MKGELIVKAIENGTVIDHIKAENIFKIISIIKIQDFDTQFFIGGNLDSKKYGKKAIIKIADKFPSMDDINRIALIDSNAVINIIHDFKVVEKKKVELPETITTYFKCINPKCITNNENVETKFKVINKVGNVNLKCYYCDKITGHNNLEVKK
jgi:aspartate carbamoyltransferase regulatory subunit